MEKTGEIVRIRLAPEHELNWDDDDNTFVAQKTIIGPETFARAHAVFRFDKERKLIGAEVDGGAIVPAEDWQQQVAARSAGKSVS